MTDSARVQNLRTKLGLSQRDFGLLIGFKGKSTNQAVSDIENGRRGRRIPPSLEPLLIMLETHGKDALEPYLQKKIEESEE